MLLRKTSAAALVAVALTMSACSSGVAVDDPAKVRELTTARAGELGLSKVALLSVSSGPKGGGGTVSMRKDDGTTAESDLGEKGESTQLASTPTPGLAVGAVPYDDLVAVLGKAKAACSDYHSAEVYATMTGKPFITSDCSDDGAPKAQMLDGKQLAELPDLSSAASLDQAIADAKVLAGEKVISFSVRFTNTQGDGPSLAVDAPAVKVAGDDCVARAIRGKTSIQFPPECQPLPSRPDNISLSQVTGAKLEAALKKGMQELGVGVDALKSADVLHSTDGALVLEVLADGSSQMAVVPLG